MSLLFLFLSICLLTEGSAQIKVPNKDRNSYLRLELNGVPDQIEMKTEKRPDASFHFAGWYGNDSPYVLVVNFKKPLTEKWMDYVVTFTPNRSGKVWIRIGGKWSNDPEERNWIIVDNVTLNGKLLPNGDFKEYREKSPDVYRPNHWILSNKAEYFLDVGDGKKPACLINHDSPITTSFMVRAGEPNTITLRLKLPARRLIPKYIPQKRLKK